MADDKRLKKDADWMRKSKNQYIPYGRQSISNQDITAVVDVLKSDFITQGPKVKEFGDILCRYTGVKYAVVVSSGTAALHIASLAARLNRADEVITSAITFAASANCILYCAGKPVFADIRKDTVNLDPQEVRNKITKKTRAIIPVHFAGHPCDLKEIKDIAKKHNLLVIEDAAHSLGAEYRDSRIGSCKYSEMTVFSFHPVKHITTGEGGAVLTNKKHLYERLLMLRNHGITKKRAKLDWFYEMQELGFNYRLTDIQCALGISQLKKLEKFIQKRRDIVEIYSQAFKDNEYFELPQEKDYAKSSWHLYPIRLKDRYKGIKKEIFKKLRRAGLGVQVHYIPVYWHPYYQELGYKKGLCPNAEDFYQREISIPLYPSMNARNIQYVINTIFKVFKKG